MGCNGSILAFTYKESADEFFITTCLSINEINHLALEPVAQAHNFHYGDGNLVTFAYRLVTRVN